MARRFFRPRAAARIAAAFLVLVLYTAAHLTYFGFPGFARNRVVRAMDSVGYSLELGSMRLLPWSGVLFEDVRIYRKGDIGPPCFEAAAVEAIFDLSGGGGSPKLTGIRVKNGSLAQAGILPTAGTAKSGDEDAPPACVSLAIEQFDLQGLWIERFVSNLRFAPGGMKLEAIDADVGMGRGSGTLSGWVSVDFKGGEYAGDLLMLMDPNHLVDYLEWRRITGLSNLIKTFEFPSLVPRIEARFNGQSDKVLHLFLDGTVLARHCLRNGAPVDRTDAVVKLKFDADRRLVILDPLVVGRPEGGAKVTLTIDSSRDTVAFKGVATADPEAVAELVVRGGSEWLDDVLFDGPARYTAEGMVNITNAAECRIEAGVESDRMTFHGLRLEDCSFHYSRTGTVVNVEHLDAKTCGGRLTGSARFRPHEGSSNTCWAVDLVAADADLASLAGQLLPGVQDLEGCSGKVSGSIAMSGTTGAGMENTVSGNGELKIREGRIIRLPLFRGLTDVVVGVLPGIDQFLLKPLLELDRADVGFSVEEGRARSDDLRIEGDVLSLKADGGYDIASGQMDFDVELRFMKKKTLVGEVMQTIFLPVTKLFRMRLRGTPRDPKWESVNF